MPRRRSIASILLFAAGTLCFFLPFASFSCGGVTAFTLTGQQLATGASFEQPAAFGPPQKQTINPELSATFALLCAAMGFILSLVGSKVAPAAAAAGGLGATGLLLLKSRMDEEIQKQGMGMVHIDYGTGYILALLLLLSGLAWNILLFLRNRKMPTAAPAIVPSPSP